MLKIAEEKTLQIHRKLLILVVLNIIHTGDGKMELNVTKELENPLNQLLFYHISGILTKIQNLLLRFLINLEEMEEVV